MAMVPMLGGEEMTDVLLGQLRLRLAREFHCDVKHKSDLREVIDNIIGEPNRATSGYAALTRPTCLHELRRHQSSAVPEAL